jgi:hypothetical protein
MPEVCYKLTGLPCEQSSPGATVWDSIPPDLANLVLGPDGIILY